MSIAGELALLANTKESLRVAIGLSTSTPFSQYAANVPWGSDVIPATGTVFDFKKNRYAKDGKAVYLDDVSEFIRLSSATKWKDGQIVEVPNNTPRISSDGLLIEPQRTNISRPSEGASAVGFGAIPPVVTNVIQDFGGRDVVVPRSIFAAGTTSGYTGRSDLGSSAYTEVGKYYIGSRYVKGVANLLQSYYAGSGSRGLIVLNISTPDKFQRIYSNAQTDLYSGTQRLIVMKNLPTDTGDVSITGAQLEDVGSLDGFASSYIKTTSSPATRSPDILNVPLLPSQTIIGDWDAGVTYSLDGGIATFAGHGYIRNITVEAL